MLEGSAAQSRECMGITFENMVIAFGRGELDICAQYWTADAVNGWPYLPIPEWPHRLIGTQVFLDMARAGMADYGGGLGHKVSRFCDLVEPDMLIAE